MKIKLVGDHGNSLLEKLRSLGFELVDENPEVIIAYGGDGALIGAQREFPKEPKLGIRRDDTCIKCPEHQDDVVLEKLLAGMLPEDELMLLRAERNRTVLIAMNDVIIRNADARTAVRFVVKLNDKPVTEEMIGDGLVACTPFGSSAYFRSITRTVTRVGIGLAFNNCTDLLHHLVIGEDERAVVQLRRGPAILAADNDPRTYEMDTGEELLISKADSVARVLAVDTLRCAACRYVHAPRRRY